MQINFYSPSCLSGILVMMLCNIQSLSAQSGNPLSLSAAIETGLKNNPAIKSAEQKVKASKGRFWSGISPAPLEASIVNDDIYTGQKLNTYGVQTIGVSQSIEFPTNYLLRGSKYSLEKNIAQKEVAQTQLSVIAAVKKAYFNLLALQAQQKIAEENGKITLDFLKKAEARLSVGDGTNLEKMTAKVNYTEAVNAIEICNNHVSAGFAELNLAMGKVKHEAVSYQLTDSLMFVPIDCTLDELLNEAATINPRLATSKLLAKSNCIDQSLAWSSVLPNFNLAYWNKKVRDDMQGYYGVSLSIGVPLWFMLDQQGKIREATANVSAARADVASESNTVNAKIETAFMEYKHEEKQVKICVQEILPQAEEIFRIALKSYEAGQITYIEYLQAQQTVINARGNYVEALYSYNLSIVALEEEIGKTIQ